MPRPPNPTTPEAKLLTDAIEAHGVGGKARVADSLGVTPAAVSQYASGNRPVPWDRAEELGKEVGLSPEKISAEYRRISSHFGPSHLERITPEIISAAIAYARKSAGLATGASYALERDVEGFATALRTTLMVALRREEGRDEEPRNELAGRDGKNGRDRGAESATKARKEGKPQGRRARKSAPGISKRAKVRTPPAI